jgi:hypothetical protein
MSADTKSLVQEARLYGAVGKPELAAQLLRYARYAHPADTQLTREAARLAAPPARTPRWQAWGAALGDWLYWPAVIGAGALLITIVVDLLFIGAP